MTTNYKTKIQNLKNQVQELDRKLMDNISGEERQLLRQKRIDLTNEISRLSRLEWEENHERLNFDDDR